MTNLEIWKNRIAEIMQDGKQVAVINNTPAACSGSSGSDMCGRCKFRKSDVEVKPGESVCDAYKRIDWMVSEYPKIRWTENVGWENVSADTEVMLRDFRFTLISPEDIERYQEDKEKCNA